MTTSPLRRILAFLVLLVTVVPAVSLYAPKKANAAASLSLSNATTVKVGEAITLNIYVNTGGASANAFDVTLRYPTNQFEGTRGSVAGSVCNLTISTPNPSGGTATLTCGTTGGFTGSGLLGSVVLTATRDSTAPASFSLTQCQVLANDENGTALLDAGSCGGGSATVLPPPGNTSATPNTGSVATPTPTPTPTPKPATTKTPTPTPHPTPSPTTTPNPKNNTATQPAETPNPGQPTPESSTPPVQPITENVATPKAQASAAATASKTGSSRRTISVAFRDLFQSFKDVKNITGNLTGVIALVLAMLPLLAIALAIVYFLYRLYILERRRKRTLDRLFEMELSELAALEGKLDLLSEKGIKGREEYREEFRRTKEKILRQLHPDFNKPVEGDKKKVAEKPAPEAASAKPAASK